MPNSNKPHETPAKRKRCEDTTAASARARGEAEQLVDTAQGYLCEAETRITEGSDGGRGIALVGIGNALCSIARTLGQIAELTKHPLRELNPDNWQEVARHCLVDGCSSSRRAGQWYCDEHSDLAGGDDQPPRLPLPGDIAPDAGGHEWYLGECLRCGIGVDKALPSCAASLLAEQALGASEGTGLQPVSPYCREPGCSAVRAPTYLSCAQHADLDTNGNPSGDSVEARIARWRNAEAGQEDEGAIELIVAAEEELAAYRERFGSLGSPVEIAVAVLCIDCQAAHRHIAGRCLNVAGCVVCVGDDAEVCACCGGKIVLESVAPEEAAAIDQLTPPGARSGWLRCGCAVAHHPDRYATTTEETERAKRCSLGWPRATVPNKPDVTTCEDSSNWCSHHCPLDAAPAPPQPSQSCGGQLPRCLEHCT